VGRLKAACGAVMAAANSGTMGHSGEAAPVGPGKGAKAVVATYCWHWEHPLFRLFLGQPRIFDLESSLE
jgi:hypothetical protein